MLHFWMSCIIEAIILAPPWISTYSRIRAHPKAQLNKHPSAYSKHYGMPRWCQPRVNILAQSAALPPNVGEWIQLAKIGRNLFGEEQS